MRMNIVGGGPAGLYLAYLMKTSWPGHDIRVFEQNAPDDTFGFGVVLSGRALSFLADADKSVVDTLSRHMETWSDQHIVLDGHRIVIDGSSYSAISRLVLLEQLQKLCSRNGIVIEYLRRIPHPDELRNCDVLVGADGANSVVRDAYPHAFGVETVELKNYFAWYGVRRRYEAHTLTFIPQQHGTFCGHHYRYTPDMSTFVAEADEAAWSGAGMNEMSDDRRTALMESVFRETLGGRKLITNKSAWRRYRIIKNARWHTGNIVLVGDALRTAHPSIGSGTRLAIEDSIALWRAFQQEGADIAAAFARYQNERQPIRDKLNRAAERSIEWYENMSGKTAQHPLDFAYDYMMRTGIMTDERLRRDCPVFADAIMMHKTRVAAQN